MKIKILMMTFLILFQSAQANTGSESAPLQKEADIHIALPIHYQKLTEEKKGAIPGTLTFLAGEDFKNNQYYLYHGKKNLKRPLVIAVHREKITSPTSDNPLDKIKEKAIKELFVKPELIHEQSDELNDHSVYSLGFIINYSERKDVDIVYIRYYKTKNGLYGVQFIRTIPPGKYGNGISIKNAQRLLKAFELLANHLVKFNNPS